MRIFFLFHFLLVLNLSTKNNCISISKTFKVAETHSSSSANREESIPDSQEGENNKKVSNDLDEDDFFVPGAFVLISVNFLSPFDDNFKIKIISPLLQIVLPPPELV